MLLTRQLQEVWKDGSCCTVPRGGLGFWRLHGLWGGSPGVEGGDLSLEPDLSPAPVSKKLPGKDERAEQGLSLGH